MARRTPPPSPPGADDTIAALYRVPLAEFVDARNALATRLRKSGDPEGSARVRALPKPTAPAWALNQVYWHARTDYDGMIRAGDRLRHEQQQMLAGRAVDSRETTEMRQAAVRQVVERAARFLADSGQPPTEATRQRLAVTADALATWGSQPQGYTPGRLDRELEPPGFAALAALGEPSLRLVKAGSHVAARSDGTSPPSPNKALYPRPAGPATLRSPGGAAPGSHPPATRSAAAAKAAALAAREAARAREVERKRLTRALDAAEREARARASAQQRAAAALSQAADDLKAAAKDVAALERQLATLQGRLERAERARADADVAATAAERARAQADEAAATARSALDELGDA